MSGLALRYFARVKPLNRRGLFALLREQVEPRRQRFADRAEQRAITRWHLARSWNRN